ncbi:MAG: MutS family DNA mismatch repair protein [Saprospiraceae bacterium]
MDIKFLETIYRNRAEENKQLGQQLKEKYNRFSVVRLIAFFAGIGIALFLSDYGIIVVVTFLVLYILAFGQFIAWHQKIAQQRKKHEILHEVNANELKYLELDFVDFENGKSFADPLHANAVDLDLFGDYSIFQYINRASTSIGQSRLAQFLTNMATFPEITARQKASQELSTQLDWRQDFQVLSNQTEDSKREIELLKNWLNDDNYIVLGKKWLNIVLYIFPIVTLSLVIAMFFGLSYQVALISFIGEMVLLRQFVLKVNETHAQTAEAEKFLKKYARIIAHIETKEFESNHLKVTQQQFSTPTTSASKALRRLSYIISQLNVRYNIFAVVLSGTVLWDLQWIKKLEAWKSDMREHLPEWFDALQEFEAINSLATLRYNHPDWTYPTIEPNNPNLVGVELGHPLIHRDKRITNDFSLAQKGQMKLITGSNMAGKSTFLRTIGLNIVLAMIGAPVCAKRLELPLLEVYTSMRTQDALQESTSSFYAELKRLKVIIEAVESRDNVFYLLDEILKGTNSNDRHKGAKALILQLIQTQGMGIVATHDLELGELEANYSDAIENLCMEVEVLEQDLVFDYKLKKGVSQSFNATFLMKNMGIKVD